MAYFINKFINFLSITSQIPSLSYSIPHDWSYFSKNSYLYNMQGSNWAGEEILGSSLSSFWIPSRIYFTLIEDFQSSSSFRIDRQTVPDG